MSDTEDVVQHFEQHGEELDHPLRAIIVVNAPGEKEGDMEERLLDGIQSFDEMNDFFDKFDDTIALPNEGHIKYEVGSDGLVVIVVDNKELREKALEFFDEYTVKKGDDEDEEDEKDLKKKRV